MTSSPGTSGIKRRREPLRVANAEELARSSHTEPSRDARIAWANDFPENFEVLFKIGEGSFGTVWSARRNGPRPRQGGGPGGGEEKGALMALKRINPTCSPSRILNEFEQMRKLGGEAAYMYIPPSRINTCTITQHSTVCRCPTAGEFGVATNRKAPNHANMWDAYDISCQPSDGAFVEIFS